MFYKPELAHDGVESSLSMLIQAMPWMLVSMFIAGLISQVIDTKVIARFLGPQSGLSGIIIGALFGLMGTGSRWAVYPLAAGLLNAKAAPGAVFSFLTSWQLVSLPRIPAEFPFLGVPYTILRAVVSFIVSIIGGLLLEWISKIFLT